MKAPAFWRVLVGISTILLGLLIVAQSVNDQVKEVFGFALACMILFIGINIFAYYLGKRTALSQNKTLFVQLVIAIIFLKMLLSVVLVIVYWKMIQPENKAFILIFIAIYLVYTVFEIYILERLAKLKPDSKKK